MEAISSMKLDGFHDDSLIQNGDFPDFSSSQIVESPKGISYHTHILNHALHSTSLLLKLISTRKNWTIDHPWKKKTTQTIIYGCLGDNSPLEWCQILKKKGGKFSSHPSPWHPVAVTWCFSRCCSAPSVTEKSSLDHDGLKFFLSLQHLTV